MNTADDLAIRLRRAAFNAALAQKDLSAISPVLSLHTVMITGTDSAILSGRKAQLMAWKREFAAKDPTVYVRTPERIELSALEPLAMEYGQWRGCQASDNGLLAAGTYVAKWRKANGEWVIEAEIYLTLQ